MNNTNLEIIDGKLSINGVQGGKFVKCGSEIFAGLSDVVTKIKNVNWNDPNGTSYFTVNYAEINGEVIPVNLFIDQSKLNELISISTDNMNQVNGAGNTLDLIDAGGVINVNGIPFAYGGAIPTVQLFIDDPNLFGSIDEEKGRTLIYNTLNGQISAATEDMLVLLTNFNCSKNEGEI
jgi:hypothetical protein